MICTSQSCCRLLFFPIVNEITSVAPNTSVIPVLANDFSSLTLPGTYLGQCCKGCFDRYFPQGQPCQVPQRFGLLLRRQLSARALLLFTSILLLRPHSREVPGTRVVVLLPCEILSRRGVLKNHVPLAMC